MPMLSKPKQPASSAGAAGAAREPAAAPARPKEKKCGRCVQDPWTKSVPFHGCIAKTQKEAKSVGEWKQGGKTLGFNDTLHVWECSACVDAAVVIQSAFEL